MKIYDKIAWQIDGGIQEKEVVPFFKFFATWLNQKGFFNNNGIEIVELGIDSSFSLNENLLTDEGIRFLDAYYDKMIAETGFNINKAKEFLKKLTR